MTPERYTEYLRTAERSNKISAIKILRERTDLALKPAKDVVEGYGRRHAVESLESVQSPAGLAVLGALVALVVIPGALFAYLSRRARVAATRPGGS